ncbi:PAS domain S-box protein [Thermodesulfobacteriota bacterium]
MISLKGSNIAIIGGGNFCMVFLQIIASEHLIDQRPTVLGVADKNDDAEGIDYARQEGIFTTNDYRELFRLKDLDIILELTRDNLFAETLKKEIPPEIRLIDHFEAVFLWNSLQIEEAKIKIRKELPKHNGNIEKTTVLFDQFSNILGETIKKRTDYSLKIERDLVEKESTMSQIIQGTTIPTVVINRDHVVTYWNRALEKLSGYAADEIVGTNKQWMPFRAKERPTMADAILSQFEDGEISKYYGEKWSKSNLIEGAYEAEEFFPHLGEEGKWLFFTAAPIKAPDGTILGAIETLWDKTSDKKAEEERERHNRELAASEKAMSQIVEGSTIPTFVLNKDHVVIHWNKALEKFVGMTAEKVQGTSRHSVPFWGKDRATMADLILDQTDEAEIQKLYGEKCRKSELIEGAYEAEAFFPDLGENGRWCWFTAAPMKDPDGTIIGAIETLWDTTENKRAEQEREKHNRELSTLCSIYGALNSPSDLEARIQKAVQDVKNFLSADAIYLYLLEKNGKFYLRYSQGVSGEACKKADVADEESTIYHIAKNNEFKIFEELPEGCVDEIYFLEEEKLFSLAYIPISSKERGMLGIIRIGSKNPGHFSPNQKAILELIGNRIGVAIENAMLWEQYIKSEEKYRNLFNNDPHPIFILDRRNFEILDTNKRVRDSYGYSREELLGTPFLKLGDENDQEVSEGFASLSVDHSSRFTKKRHYRKGGRTFYVNMNISLAKYGESDVVIASTTDITESVEQEARLIQAGKMTTLGVMAAGMAHEINQPLNVIQVCADFFQKMLNRGQPIQDDDLRTMANDIVSNVARATDVIKHVRDFARQSEVVKSKVNINEPIRDVFKVLGHQIKVHEIDLDLDLDLDLPLIMAEHNRLEQVFINLVTNSIDAMDEKDSRPAADNLEKRLKIKSFTENGHVVVSVSDTGIGMSEEVKKNIFEPFFTTKKIGKGTGLGVSISYGIVKDYDGVITLESEPGKGATFTIRFPALPKNAS